MPFDFDLRPERRGTASEKWDALSEHYGRDDVLPMWVADMDFSAPPALVEALEARVRHGVYGYTMYDEEAYEATAVWVRSRHGWPVERDWIVFGPSVMPHVGYAIGAFTRPGDGVIVQRPVYDPFGEAIERNGRVVVNNPLVRDGDGNYRMDLDDLRAKARAGARLLILCNPHNPVGRVWTRAELTALSEVAAECGLLVVSDEIWADLTYPGARHVPYASVVPSPARDTVVLMAPTKTFNLAGLASAYAIIPDPELRRRYREYEDAVGHPALQFGNVMALTALRTAYGRCADWVDELRAYLGANLAFLEDFLAREIPEIRPVHPEGTYLVWLDCRALGLDADALDAFFRNRARVALKDGRTYGSEGEGFQRINIGCPRSMLAEALERMAAAVQEHRRAGTQAR